MKFMGTAERAALLHDPGEINRRRQALATLGAHSEMGGRTALVREETVARLLEISPYMVRTLCPQGLKFASNGKYVILCDPLDLLAIYDPRVRATRAGRLRRAAGAQRVPVEGSG